MNELKKKISKSLSFQNRARQIIPGMTQLLSKSPDRFSFGVWPGYYKKAKGVEIWDLDGNKYIDMSIGGIGANILGYADADVDEAVIQAIKSGNSSSLNCPEEVELAELLCELHPWAQMVRYARTGGEAMAIAIRIARAHTGRDKIAFCGYHGWHDWYLAANLGENDALGGHLQAGLIPRGVPKVLAGTAFPFKYNDIKQLKKIVHKNRNQIAAIVMEPIRNFKPEDNFFKELKCLAEESSSVLIFDEISSGFRMNTGGAHLLFDWEPDIAVFSKALGNGYPIAAIIGKSVVMNSAESTFISSTNWTEKIGPTAAIATIKKHRKYKVGDRLVDTGNMVQNGWCNLSKKHMIPIKISGIPPLSHFSFELENASAVRALFIQLMVEQNFLASNLFYPMFSHSDIHISTYLSAVDRSFGELKTAIKKNTVSENLIGEPAVSGFKRMN